MAELTRLITLAKKKANDAAEILRQEKLQWEEKVRMAEIEASKHKAAANKLEEERIAAEQALKEELQRES